MTLWPRSNSVPTPAAKEWLCGQDPYHGSVLVASLSLSPLMEVVGTFLGMHEGKASFGDLQEDPQCSGLSTRQVGCLLLHCDGWDEWRLEKG